MDKIYAQKLRKEERIPCSWWFRDQIHVSTVHYIDSWTVASWEEENCLGGRGRTSGKNSGLGRGIDAMICSAEPPTTLVPPRLAARRHGSRRRLPGSNIANYFARGLNVKKKVCQKSKKKNEVHHGPRARWRDGEVNDQHSCDDAKWGSNPHCGTAENDPTHPAASYCFHTLFPENNRTPPVGSLDIQWSMKPWRHTAHWPTTWYMKQPTRTVHWPSPNTNLDQRLRYKAAPVGCAC